MTALTQTAESDVAALISGYRRVRHATRALCLTLENEDYGLQAMPEVSPPKWHLAHTSWFFETFLLKPFATQYRPFHPQYEYLFNSYYNGVGAQYPRARRGLISRPTVRQVFEYRTAIDEAMVDLLQQADHPARKTIHERCMLGIHHEQQHQELLCTDIKYSFSCNPLYPEFAKNPAPGSPALASELRMLEIPAQDANIGFQGNGFCFDNELPVHVYRLPAFRLADRLLTNAEYLAFVEDGGYAEPMLWLSDGWAWRREQQATHPCYWLQRDGAWCEYTLYGLQALDPDQPVSHVNYYEADACARWLGRRLPGEHEWEAACRYLGAEVLQTGIRFHPQARQSAGDFQLFGSLWQWTSSAYSTYPGYRPAPGAIGEYNGKFMCNQLVLRGSSCVTPPGHARSSYRNFFYPRDRWQFSGIRLAADL